MGVVPLTITPSDPLATFFASCSHNFMLYWPRGLSFRGDTTMIALNWNLRVLPGHCGFFMPLSQQAKKGVMVLAGVIDSDYQGETALLFHNGSKKRLCLE